MDKMLHKINNNSMRNFFLIFFAIDALSQIQVSKIDTLICPFMLAMIIVNDEVRSRRRYSDLGYIISVILTISLITIIGSTYCPAIIYYTCLLVCEILNRGFVKYKNTIYTMIFISVLIVYKSIYSIDYIKENPVEIIKSLGLFLGFSIGISSLTYYAKCNFEAKLKMEALNEELKEKNLRLEEYSKKVEELTKINERNRIAGEIHDSLGHSLSALRMQLEFTKNIITTKPEKAKDIVVKCEEIVRTSIHELRTAVYELRDDNVGFIDSVNNLIRNIKTTDQIEIDFSYNNEFTNCKKDMKDFLYRTIQEGITNSIKHGKATVIKIVLEYSVEKGIELVIEDNGKGVSDISENQGLKSIKKRAEAFDGTVEFYSEIEKGFVIKACI